MNKNSYYGHVYTLKADDKRMPVYLKQLEERGFDDTECWSLNTSICSYILPRLKRFREITCGHPGFLADQESWYFILDCMIEAFEIMTKDRFADSVEEELKIEKGLNYFRQYFFSLWF